jgi:N-acetyl-gamma-glutamyl-phosphate reductase
MKDKARVGVVGASGYAGGELIRILSNAPCFAITYLASDTFEGMPVRAAFPGLHLEEPRFSRFEPEAAISRCDALLLAQSNGEAMKHAPPLVEAGRKVVDLSADYRLKDPELYPDWYGLRHSDLEGLKRAAYGLTELNRDAVRGSNLVANPGCYPTAAILALAPLLARGWVDLRSIVIDAKSGVSGAGRSRVTPEYLYTELNESIKAYGVGGAHRHTPEIEQELTSLAGASIRVAFTPHLIPMTRGLLATCYAVLKDERRLHELFECYSEYYNGEPFVKLFPKGEQPATKAATGTNNCLLGLALDERTGRVVVTGAIDNLGKGAAGQAVQNLNAMLGLPESHGLEAQGIWP